MGDAGVKWSALYWLLCGFAGVCLVVVCCLPFVPVAPSLLSLQLLALTASQTQQSG